MDTKNRWNRDINDFERHFGLDKNKIIMMMLLKQKSSDSDCNYRLSTSKYDGNQVERTSQPVKNIKQVCGIVADYLSGIENIKDYDIRTCNFSMSNEMIEEVGYNGAIEAIEKNQKGKICKFKVTSMLERNPSFDFQDETDESIEEPVLIGQEKDIVGWKHKTSGNIIIDEPIYKEE